MYVNIFGQQASSTLEGLGQDAACGLGITPMKRRTAAPAKASPAKASPVKAAMAKAASAASALTKISMAPVGWQNAMKVNGAIMYSRHGAFNLIPEKGHKLTDTALLPALIAHARAVQRCVGWPETGVLDEKMLKLLKAIDKTPTAQRSIDPGLVKFLKDRIHWSRTLSGVGLDASDAALAAGATVLLPGMTIDSKVAGVAAALPGVKVAGAAWDWAFGDDKHKYRSPAPDKATFTFLGKIVAEKRLATAAYQPVLAGIVKEAVWYGPFLSLFSVVGDYNQKVVVDGRLKSDGAFKKINFKAGPFEFDWERQLPFMRLVAAVNHVMGYPSYIKKGAKPALAMATPLVLMFLSYMRYEHRNSSLGKFVYDNITWSRDGRDSKYKKLDSKDMVRISSELTRLGGANSVSDAIMAIYKAGDTSVPPPRYVPKAAAAPAAKAAAAPAAKKSPSKKIGRKKASQIGKSAAKPAEEKAAAQQAPLKLTAVAVKIGAKPSDMAKVASAQSGKVTLKLRDQLVLSATNLMRVGRGKQQELAGAKQQLAEASTPEEKAQAQAKVQQVEAQVQQAQAETSKVEQAIAQVDNAMALSTAAQAAAVEATQGDSQATAFAASKAAAATSAAVQAAANVLPAQNIAGAIKEAVTETQQEVASQAEQSGDDSLTRAMQALAESQVMQDAVKEGAASAEALSEEGGSEEGGSEEGGSEEGGSEEGGSEEGGSEEGGSEEGGSEEGGSEEETAPTDGLSGIGGSNEPSVLGIVLATAGGIGLAWLGARNSRR